MIISRYVIDKLPISDKSTMAPLTNISPHTYILVVTIKLMEPSDVSKTRSFLYYRPCQAPGGKKGSYRTREGQYIEHLRDSYHCHRCCNYLSLEQPGTRCSRRIHVPKISQVVVRTSPVRHGGARCGINNAPGSCNQYE